MSRSGYNGVGYLQVQNAYSAGSMSAYAWCIWTKNRAAPGTSFDDSVFTFQQAGTFNFNAGFQWNSTQAAAKQAFFNRTAGGAFINCQIPNTLLANTWYHIGGRLIGTVQDVFLNGVKVKTVAGGTPSVATVNPTLMSNAAGGTPTLNGVVAEAAIWGSVAQPSDSDFAAIFAGALPSSVAATGLIGYWPCAGLASPEPDSSASNNPMVLTSAPANANENPPGFPLLHSPTARAQRALYLRQ